MYMSEDNNTAGPCTGCSGSIKVGYYGWMDGWMDDIIGTIIVPYLQRRLKVIVSLLMQRKSMRMECKIDQGIGRMDVVYVYSVQRKHPVMTSDM